GWIYTLTNRLDEAIGQYRLLAQLEPDFPYTYLGLAWAHAAAERFNEAIAHLSTAKYLMKDHALISGLLGYCYAKTGQAGEAARLISQLGDGSTPQCQNLLALAAIHAGTGEKDRALRYLDEAAQARVASLPLMLLAPEFTGLSGEPGFEAVRAKIGLPV